MKVKIALSHVSIDTIKTIEKLLGIDLSSEISQKCDFDEFHCNTQVEVVDGLSVNLFLDISNLEFIEVSFDHDSVNIISD